ncbi:hypothetical protein AFK68_16485 [Hydrocoleum sp. CS-953]|uniref:DUF2330 domain-containing protein n=1 Tax=Hydrocoleum sp. CS-953 TaxID=1671698 RepID=UPI000B9AA1DC|nr:DUF2330 domain-containing protein [Hydrocoleum sp. CS-953]OZH53611.1 hypothetical protein AFK68_16485 [Hydrocoleum sp. CS-953]
MNHRWIKYPFVLLCVLLIFLNVAPAAWAFCGFFVAKADSQLYNSSSQVIIAHDGNRNIFFMANDYQGDVQDFARIVPIPVVPKREQVRVSNNEIIQALDDFTAPRLVEYVDRPCREEYTLYLWLAGIATVISISIWLILRGWGVVLIICFFLGLLIAVSLPSFLNQANYAKQSYDRVLNVVTVEDQFTVGEYDITILSANESNSLTDWLVNNGYKIPAKAQPMLESYIQQGMKFFVTKVNLEAFQKQGYGFLRPVVLDYESDKFMLPIRLGTLNAVADQDLNVYILSRDTNKFAEVANYPTLLIPTDAKSKSNRVSGEELPEFIKDDFGNFYQSLFQKEYERSGKNSAFLEYAGPLYKCDPCSVPFEKIDELIGLLKQEGLAGFWAVTRLHIRYNEENFPQDLIFREVSDQDILSRAEKAGKAFSLSPALFQGRYVIRRPADGAFCLSGGHYRSFRNQWANNLAKLTGWDLQEIKKKM